MWIKTPEGNLLNLETGFEIGKVDQKVVFVYPQNDFNHTKIESLEQYAGEISYFVNLPERFVYKDLACFDNDADAWKYIDKLAKKLGAEEV